MKLHLKLSFVIVMMVFLVSVVPAFADNFPGMDDDWIWMDENGSGIDSGTGKMFQQWAQQHRQQQQQNEL